MEHKEEFKKIGIPGIDHYEISILGTIRNTINGNIIKPDGDIVFLKVYSKKRPYSLTNLIAKAFHLQTNDSETSPEESETYEHSKDERLYGTGVHKEHWAQLKKQIEQIKNQKLW